MKKENYHYSPDMEDSILGTILMFTDTAYEAYGDCEAANITAKSFFNPSNQSIWDAIKSIAASGKPIEVSLVANTLSASGRLDGVGGLVKLSELMSLGSMTMLCEWVKIVRELETRRDLLNLCKIGAEHTNNRENSIDTAIGFIDNGITSIGGKQNQDTTKRMAEVSLEYSDEIERLLNGKPNDDGLKTGFPDFDRLTNGLQKKTMVVLAARPSVGKTSLALNMAENIIKKDKDCTILFFSLEMGRNAIYTKLLATHAEASISRLKDGIADLATLHRLRQSKAFVDSSRLFINDNSDLTISQMRSIARQKNNREKLGLVILDYLQFVKPTDPKNTREQQVSEISRGLKAMAKELDCPVVVLSQLSRDSDKSDRRPKLSDLRDSGAIEQDADVVAFIWPNREENFVELIVSKNRTGGTGITKLFFNPQITKFTQLTNL